MKIPKSVNKLTLKQFIKLSEIEKSNVDDFEKGEQILMLVTGINQEQINQLPVWKLEFYFRQIANLRASKPNLKVNKWLLIKGKLYLLTKSEKHLNTNQFTAADTFNSDVIGNFNKLAAIIYRHKPLFGDAKFTDESFMQLSDYFSNCKVGNIYGAVFFYSNRLKASKEILEFYSQSSMEKIRNRLKVIEQDMNTDGTKSWMALQAETLLKKMN